ncbi:unnamed protein product, partial [Rotaria sordida]
VAQHLDEESHRIESYLHPSTLAPLIKKVGEIRIYDQLEVIYTENPKLYVKTILDNHIEFFKLVRCFLNNDQHFIAALNKTCGNFY